MAQHVSIFLWLAMPIMLNIAPPSIRAWELVKSNFCGAGTGTWRNSHWIRWGVPKSWLVDSWTHGDDWGSHMTSETTISWGRWGRLINHLHSNYIRYANFFGVPLHEFECMAMVFLSCISTSFGSKKIFVLHCRTVFNLKLNCPRILTLNLPKNALPEAILGAPRSLLGHYV